MTTLPVIGQAQPDDKLSRRWLLLIWGVLILAAAEFAWLGSADFNGALSYAGRLDGALLLLSAAVVIVAALALLDHKNPLNARKHKYSGYWVAIGVFLSFIVNLGLLILQIESISLTEFIPSLTGFILLWMGLTAAASACLFRLYRQHKSEALKTPKYKTFTLGAVITTLIGVGTFAYTQVYQPYTTPALVVTTIDLGRAKVKDGTVTVPIHLKTKNIGQVGVFVLGSLYQVSARGPIYSQVARSDKEWLQDLNDGQSSLLRYGNEKGHKYNLLAEGLFVRQGRKLEPGSEATSDTIVQFPVSNSYDVLDATSDVVFLRADRAVLTSDEYRQSGRSSWHKDKSHAENLTAPAWVAKGKTEAFRYKSRIIHSSAVLEYTRSNREVSVWWVLEEPSKSWNGPYLVASIAPEGEGSQTPDPGSAQRLTDEYGLDHSSSGRMQKTMQQLIN
ncbi:hypothetical protein Spla01_05534 [Streptomyces platensis]|uniref:Uncharacterized protein n=1 Tax=Streptomyces platensis TaxID=58346 RepID=A0ABX3XYF8_STRPT|nr:hypothetical protein [Streptomyces platensis]OSY45583.1 hypothetical protein BG653_02873 [Streptomyces platensis]